MQPRWQKTKGDVSQTFNGSGGKLAAPLNTHRTTTDTVMASEGCRSKTSRDNRTTINGFGEKVADRAAKVLVKNIKTKKSLHATCDNELMGAENFHTLLKDSEAIKEGG